MPDLLPAAAETWGAFFDLSRSRRAGGFGWEGLDPFALELWLDRHLVHDLDERNAFHEMIGAMDMMFLNSVKPKQSSKPEEPS